MANLEPAPLAPMLTQEQAAAILGVNPRTLEAWRQRREGPPWAKVGRLARYRANELHAWIEAQTVRAAR